MNIARYNRALAALLSLVVLPPLTAAAQNGGLAIGSPLAMGEHSLSGADDQDRRLQDLRGARGTVLVFWSNNCPWVDKNEERLLQVVQEFTPRGFAFALINANDPIAFPEESLQASIERASRSGYAMPYLRDEGSQLARTLGASRTPHVFVLDADNALSYSGALDDSPGDPSNVQSRYLVEALTAVLDGRPVPTAQTKAFGCTIRFE